MIGLLVASRHPTVRVVGVEINADLARHAGINARANALEGRCGFVRGDLREAPRFLPPGHFHRVVANPPFRSPGAGAASPDPARAGARQERTFSLADLTRVSAALLRHGGTLDLVHLAERLPEIFTGLVADGLAPKVLQLVAPLPGSPPRLCLVSAIKGARPGLRIMPQLVVHERPGRYTREMSALLEVGDHQRPSRDEKPQVGK